MGCGTLCDAGISAESPGFVMGLIHRNVDGRCPLDNSQCVPAHPLMSKPSVYIGVFSNIIRKGIVAGGKGGVGMQLDYTTE